MGVWRQRGDEMCAHEVSPLVEARRDVARAARVTSHLSRCRTGWIGDTAMLWRSTTHESRLAGMLCIQMTNIGTNT